MSVNWAGFSRLVRDYHQFVLTGHVRPDCDCLGSQLALAQALESLGKQVRIVNGHATPTNLAFIDPECRIQTLGQGIQPQQLDDADVIVVLDTSAWAQLGSMADVVRSTGAKKVVIDHHVSEDDLGAELFKDTRAEATGRLIVEALDALGIPLSAELALPLFAAIATDTGWFRFASTSQLTFQVIGRLVGAGARPEQIYKELYERDTLGRIRLRGRILARLEVEREGRLAHTYVRKEDFQNTGALPSDTEDVVNMALAVEGTQVAVILVEQMDGGFKLSLRSRCGVDCSQVAAQFGGGGHRAAAGAFLPGSLEDVQPQVLSGVRHAMDRLCQTAGGTES